MREYKGFTHEQRMANLRKVKKAIKDGIIEDPKDLKCEICGQEHGVKEYHCYNYDPKVAMQSMNVLCWKCHRNLHVLEIGETHKYYNYVVYYFKKVGEGEIFPPVYTKYYTKEDEIERRANYEYRTYANKQRTMG